jgi:hypothetical protein
MKFESSEKEIKKEAAAEETPAGFHLSENEWKWEFAVLRHMEILGATKKEARILYALFQEGK